MIVVQNLMDKKEYCSESEHYFISLANGHFFQDIKFFGTNFWKTCQVKNILPCCDQNIVWHVGTQVHDSGFGYLHLLYGQLVGQTPELATGKKPVTM